MVKKKLKSNTFIKPSRIHGLGLFAIMDIKKGQQIWQGVADFSAKYLDEWIAYERKWRVKSYEFYAGYCMINHSETPNTIRKGKDLKIVAVKNIKAGEEITEDYNALPPEENPFIGFNLQKLVYEARNKKHRKFL